MIVNAIEDSVKMQEPNAYGTTLIEYAKLCPTVLIVVLKIRDNAKMQEPNASGTTKRESVLTRNFILAIKEIS